MMFDPNAVREDGKTGNAFVYIACFFFGMAGAGYFLMANRGLRTLPFCFSGNCCSNDIFIQLFIILQLHV